MKKLILLFQQHMSAIRTSQVKESDRLVLLQGINTAFLTASLGVAGAV